MKAAEIILTFLAATNGRPDVYLLAGPANAKFRARLMSDMEGQRVPQAKAGIHALGSALYKLAGISPDQCLASQEDRFLKFSKKMLLTEAFESPMARATASELLDRILEREKRFA